MNYAERVKNLEILEGYSLSGELEEFVVATPIDGSEIAKVNETPIAEIPGIVDCAQAAFLKWRNVPAPRRGELVRLLGEELRQCKQELGELVTLDCGKILTEGLGEVQEMIDICDFAVGLSRQLYGLTIASERPGHRMMETWHPLGVTAVISAFNFPVAVWAWNTTLALVCGNPVIWKPSEKAPLSAVACHLAMERAMIRFGDEAPTGLHHLVLGGAAHGAALVENPQVALVSATGSTRMGKAVAPKVAMRFGRSLLELGGNAAMIVAPSADLDLAVRAIVFSAVGTCGQRCTSLRRIIVHESIRDTLINRLKAAYTSIEIGDPLAPATLVGPMIDEEAFTTLQTAQNRAIYQGGKVIVGGKRAKGPGKGVYVRPILVDMPSQTEIVCQETFGPILYLIPYTNFEDAIRIQNAVPQGLSSSIFTTDLREAEAFTAAAGSDCGIANVNIGPSGAEIGGAFGGEKETGGGRESGSDAWRAYMRRQTNTVNYSNDLPLAQGVKFEL